jgi:hypothetical protein
MTTSMKDMGRPRMVKKRHSDEEVSINGPCGFVDSVEEIKE